MNGDAWPSEPGWAEGDEWCCARCRSDDELELIETADGPVCLGCLTMAEQESCFEHGTAAPPPWWAGDGL